MKQDQRLPVYQLSLSFPPCLLGHVGESQTFSPTPWVPTRLSVQPFSKNDRRRHGGHRTQGLWAAVAGSRGITHCRVAAAGNNNHIPPCGSVFTHTPMLTTSSSKSPPRLYFLDPTALCREMSQHPGNGLRFPGNTPTSQGEKVLLDVVSCDASNLFFFSHRNFFWVTGQFPFKATWLQADCGNMQIPCVLRSFGNKQRSHLPEKSTQCLWMSYTVSGENNNPSRKIRFPVIFFVFEEESYLLQ